MVKFVSSYSMLSNCTFLWICNIYLVINITWINWQKIITIKNFLTQCPLLGDMLSLSGYSVVPIKKTFYLAKIMIFRIWGCKKSSWRRAWSNFSDTEFLGICTEHAWRLQASRTNIKWSNHNSTTNILSSFINIFD